MRKKDKIISYIDCNRIYGLYERYDYPMKNDETNFQYYNTIIPIYSAAANLI
jgi:hypothetical protein